MGKRSAGSIDIIIGEKIRKLRVENGLSMREFAGLIGITQQQAHKYERGVNRVAVGRLYVIAEALNVPVSHFFEDMPDAKPTRNSGNQRKNMELMKYFQAIPSIRQQEAISILVRVLAGN